MTDQPMPSDGATVSAVLSGRLDTYYARRIQRFLSENINGNIVLHVKQGIVQGVRIEEVCSKS